MHDEMDKANHDDETKWLPPAYMADQNHSSKQGQAQIKNVVRLPVVCASSLYIRTSADRLITLLLIFSSLVFNRTIQI
jgi:hypothetical protein